MNKFEVTIWMEDGAETLHCLDVQMQENFVVLVQDSGAIIAFAAHAITGFEVHPIEEAEEVPPWEEGDE